MSFDDFAAPDLDDEAYAPTPARAPRLRLMRGQVAVREMSSVTVTSTIWVPEDGPRQRRTHRGIVLGLGAPPRTRLVFVDGRWIGGVEVPWEYGIGDVVQYHFTHHEEAWTTTWPDDGGKATWLSSANVDAVIDP